jgi:hypothetical protein
MMYMSPILSVKGDFYVYALALQCGDVRYVGSSCRPRVRFNSHSPKSRDSSIKTRWIRELFEFGMRPNMVILQGYSTREDALVGEGEWIDKFRSLGHDLLNVTRPRKTTP